MIGTTNTKSKFRFSIQKLHHCICESAVCTMQKIFYEYTQYFSSYERKQMPLFVVLKHIKLSNLIKQKSATNKESRMIGTTNTKSKFRFLIQKLHYCICESVVCMYNARKSYEYT